ncbi:alpha/beta fold hydrolase [Mobilicoccus pelagius]|uniref:Putative non-heme haloperoxidase n=1 Tax=Mobilicoccus pelagius NBRC 104925 TaxID=1089455 RepID=H5UPS3_9MICO|nr:alpha/beta hydrolase [Mobilicoccus pelagius]GAB47728.1 putative non-heme haloperoxidase [Mobilicoccus pelagius NBRC 104925]
MTEVTTDKGLFRKVRLHVDDTGGSGRPIVLIHGWPLSGASWAPQVPALTEAGFRVVTYDRRGFGRSDKPKKGYDYDTLADDLAGILDELDLRDVTLVGFSMGGGEVVRYLSRHGGERIRSVVLLGAVPPYLMKGPDNPDGPLTPDLAAQMSAQLAKDEDDFYEDFTRMFFSAGETLMVTEQERQQAFALAKLSDKAAALEAMTSWGKTDFRDDLPAITGPLLVIHGDSDAAVPFEGSGLRTHQAVPGSQLEVIEHGPHGLGISHAEEVNRLLVEFCRG